MRGTVIREIASEGYYWGDFIIMGRRGRLLLRNRIGQTRYVSGGQSTNSSLTMPAEYVRREMTVTLLPSLGATVSEVFHSVDNPDFGTTLPGDLTSSERSLTGMRRAAPREIPPGVSEIDAHIHVVFPDSPQSGITRRR